MKGKINVRFMKDVDESQNYEEYIMKGKTK